ncbi:MAG: protein translocase subunit SecDF [Bacteroidota bacterium]|nr:protein translocase subunit SecDF [Bacteroidota bacterium]
MQNKGLIRLFAISLTLVCLFYLSFTVVTNMYNKKAKEYAAGNPLKEYNYLDSIGSEKVWLGYTLKECRDKEINLGLDLKGGMNVTLEVSVADIIRSLSDFNTNPNFNQALNLATERQKTNSQISYIDLFVNAYTELDPHAKLASIFSTFELKDKISLTSSNSDVVKVLKTEVEGAIANSFNVLRQRIDRFGVVQPNIQKLGNGRILVELPGIKEPARVRKLLQGSANLEFWETYDLNEIISNITDANKVLATLQAAGGTAATAAKDTTKAVAAAGKTQAKKAKSISNVDSLKAALAKKTATASDSTKVNEKSRKENPLFAVLQLNAQGGQVARGPVIGLAQSKDTALVNAYLKVKQVREVLPRDLGFRWSVKALDKKGEIFQLVAIKITNRDGRAPLAGDVITDARADFSQTSAYANVSMSMNSEGTKTWARMTKDNIGKSIAIALDGYIYSFPTVNTEITGGSSQITGNFTVEEAKDLANTLKSGKMPAPAHIVQENVVGPSLGQEAINNGLVSFIIAFILVLLYMILYYGFVPGIIADLALLANVFFLIGILASFTAVLTLPGIAGIVLTLGMAVDANVLMYERIREEMNKGKTMKRAIDDGIGSALSAIIDSNVTTLITATILAVFGTGPIKGFAVTEIIGVITSFFTSVFLTRYMLYLYANHESSKEISFITGVTKNWFKDTKVDFMGIRKWMYGLSGALILISCISFGVRGFSLGVDFSGGRNYVVSFDQPVSTEQVRTLLQNAFEGDMPQVITIGSENQVRIATKYKINDNASTIDNEIEGKLYENLKPLLKKSVTRAEFIKENIKSSQKVGPTVADDIKRSAVWAVLFAIIGIGVYIFIRFREWGYALGAIVSLAHDAIITLGLFSLFYGFLPFSMEIDQSFIAAILTVIGYSVHDTVINYDRIRENVGLFPKRDRISIINLSVNEMLGRTFSTTATVILTLLAIFIFGGETIRGFIFAMLFGIFIGTYSSVFIASPITVEMEKLISIARKKKEIKKLAHETEK